MALINCIYCLEIHRALKKFVVLPENTNVERFVLSILATRNFDGGDFDL
jgi:hypothetical protein